MKTIVSLYHANYKWYDYPVANAEHLDRKSNSPKPFRIYHEDGTYSHAYTYGEQHYTYSISELQEVRKKDVARHNANSERRALLNALDKLDTDTLRELVEAFC